MKLAVHRDRTDSAEAALASFEPKTWWRAPAAEGSDFEFLNIVVHTSRSQEMIDAISDTLGPARDQWSLSVIATEAVLPEPEDEETLEELSRTNLTAAREEIFSSVQDNSRLTRDYLILTALATFVAAIGQQNDQVSVVIGSMVIAPLLGPILALAFGTALGNRGLLVLAARTLGAGIAVAVVVGIALGFLMEVNTASGLLQFDTPLGLSTTALPLATGAAAALMMASPQTTNLVGVAVAAALLPPLAGFGLMIGAGETVPAIKALVTVLANIVALTLAAQVVFLWKGIRPGTFLSERHQNSIRWMVGMWAGLVLMLTVALVAFGDLLAVG